MYMQPLSGLRDVSVGVRYARSVIRKSVWWSASWLRIASMTSNLPVVLGDVVADLQQVEFDRMVLVQAGNWGLRGQFRSGVGATDSSTCVRLRYATAVAR